MKSTPREKIVDILTVIIVPLLIAAALIPAQKFPLLLLLGLAVMASWIVSWFKLHYYLLALIALFLPFSFEVPVSVNFSLLMPTEPLIAVALLTMFWDIIYRPDLFKVLFENETKWIMPLLATYGITTIFSSLIMVSIKFSLLNISYILVFFIWQKYLFKNRPEVFPALLALYSLSLTAVILYAVYRYKQYEWNPVTIKGVFSPFFKDNTIFGASVAVIAAFWLVYSARVQFRTGRLPGIIAGLFFLAAVLFSNSRAAVLSIAFFGFMLILLLLRVRIVHLAMGILIIAVMSVGFRDRLKDFLSGNTSMSHNPNSTYAEHIKSSGNITTDNSNIERLNRWLAGLAMFTEKPFTGFGPGTYQFAYIPYQNPRFKSDLTVEDPWHIPENSGGTAHSEYILALSEMGILGLLAMLIFIARMAFIAFESAHNLKNRQLIIVSFCALSTYFFHAFFNNFLNTDKFAFLVWGNAAWMFSNYEIIKYDRHRLLQRD